MLMARQAAIAWSVTTHLLASRLPLWESPETVRRLLCIGCTGIPIVHFTKVDRRHGLASCKEKACNFAGFGVFIGHIFLFEQT